jgi:hypothetical protein
LGNHRYPIGFSGDTIVAWESLAFQPYFTATAANVGYGWWSHDIGGHLAGIEEAELYIRWVQFGVFSPVLRLHSTKNPYHERHPWGYDAETLRVTRKAMQLRHALIPYLYAMAWRYHESSIPPLRPMYHDYPTHEQAYHCPQQYAFGSELIVAPFATPADPETGRSRQVVWLPPGQWFGFFTGLSYPGDGWYAIHGGLDDIPVFAKAGAIVPLAPRRGWGGVETPDALEVYIFPGADNRFELYEDDEKSSHSRIPLSQTWEPQQLRFEIGAVAGDIGHLPAQRAITLVFEGIAESRIVVQKNGETAPCDFDYNEGTATMTVGPISLSPTDQLIATVETEAETLLAARDHRCASIRALLRACRLNTNAKHRLDMRLEEIIAFPSVLSDFELDLGESLGRALTEIITGAGAHKAPDPATGGERVVLWNNTGLADVSFRFVALPLVGMSAVKRAGRLPRFAALTQWDDRLQLVQGSGSQRVDSVTQWLDALAGGYRPETVGLLDAVVQFNFGGAEALRAYVHISPIGLAVTRGTDEGADVTIEADSEDWLQMINGEVEPTELFLSGRLRILGDLDLLTRLTDILGGDAQQNRFKAERWKLSVNYLGMLTLDLGPAAG